ncbi:MAG: VCBS repeat-containing protein [Phycisphaerae bacterium]|nr:VCBS repeat-containing protein [Phycisphaerae bacterium]
MKRDTVMASISAGIGAALASTATAQWVTFENQTATRLVAPPNLVVNDVLEKDFAWGDLDNDGDVDLVVMRKFPGHNQGGFPNLLLMNEGGVLVDRTTEYASDSDVLGDGGFLAPTNDRQAELVDVDNDGWLDVVTCTTMSDQVDAILGQPRVYRNKGNGRDGAWLGLRFEDERIPELKAANGTPANPRFCSMAVADLTGDGYVDIFYVDADGGNAPGATICFDLNHDGDTSDPGECQLCAAETPSNDFQNKFLVNAGAANPGFFIDSTTTFFTASQLASTFGNGVFIEDMDGDGLKDVVRADMLTQGPNVGILRALDADGTAWSGPDIVYVTSLNNVAPIDVNGDGAMDIVMVDQALDKFLINTGNGPDGFPNFSVFQISDSATVGTGGNSIVVADLDKDGWDDVITADAHPDQQLLGFCGSSFDRMHIYRNTFPTVGLSSNTLDEIGQVIPNDSLGSTFDVAAIDINGDTWLDLVIGRCAGIDIWINTPPFGISFTYPNGRPWTLVPGESTSFDVNVSVLGGGPIVEGSLTLVSRINGGPWSDSPLSGGPVTYHATLPAARCGDVVDYYLSGVVTEGNVTTTDPDGAPAAFHSAVPATPGLITAYATEFENGPEGWTTQSVGAGATGAWELGDPVGTFASGAAANPENDNTIEGVSCWTTDNGPVGGAATANDVDNGPVRLLSPTIVVPPLAMLEVSYAAWVYCNDSADPNEADVLAVECSFDGGVTWHHVRNVGTTSGAWQTFTDAVGPVTGTTVQVRLSVQDLANNSITEAGVDSFGIKATQCVAAPTCPSDLTADGTVDGADLAALLGAWGRAGGSADLDRSGLVDGGDLAVLLGSWGGCGR